MSLSRDCLRFAFMEVLQNELDKIRHLWKTHKIAKARTGNRVCGIPDKLFYNPEVQGMSYYQNLRSQLLFQAPAFILCQMCLSFDWKFNLHIGYENCFFRCHVKGQDVDFCRQYISPTSPPVPEEFIDVAHIAMTHNGWSMPKIVRMLLNYT